MNDKNKGSENSPEMSGSEVASRMIEMFREEQSSREVDLMAPTTSLYNQMVVARIRMLGDPRAVSDIVYGEEKRLQIVNPDRIPNRFDPALPFRIMPNDPRAPWLLAVDGVISLFGKEYGVYSVAPLEQVGTWTSDDQANTAPIFGYKDKDGTEYRSALFAGLMTITLRQGEKEVTKTRLVMRSSRGSIGNDRHRYRDEVAAFMKELKETAPGLQWMLKGPKPLTGEASLIDLDTLAGFQDPASKWKVQTFVPADKVRQRPVGQRAEDAPVEESVPVREIDIDSLQF